MRSNVSACMQHFQRQKVSKQQSNTRRYWVPVSIWFDQVQITDFSEPVPVHLWPDHSTTIAECQTTITRQPFCSYGCQQSFNNSLLAVYYGTLNHTHSSSCSSHRPVLFLYRYYTAYSNRICIMYLPNSGKFRWSALMYYCIGMWTSVLSKYW